MHGAVGTWRSCLMAQYAHAVREVVDEAAGQMIDCPTLVLASRHNLVRPGAPTPIDVWRGSFAPGAEGVEIDSGHFIAEENPEATLAALIAYL